MMTALIILGGLSMLSTLFILAALFAAKRTPQHSAEACVLTSVEMHETAAALVPTVRLAA
jgi:hypothetical protein